MYFVVLWHCVICIICVLFAGVAACNKKSVCTVCRCDSVFFYGVFNILCFSGEFYIYIWSVFCELGWQRVISMRRVLCGGKAACFKYVLCTVWFCVKVLFVWCV